MERVEMGVMEAEHHKRNHWDERHHQQQQRELSNESNPENVNKCNQPQEQNRHNPVLQWGAQWDPGVEVVRHCYSVRSAHEEGAGPVQPAALKSPEIAESRAAPAVKPALDRHGGGHFGGCQRDGDSKQERDDEQESKRQSRSGGRNHGFESERPTGAVREQHGHERQQANAAKIMSSG